MGHPPEPQPPVRYEIRVKGVLDSGWSAWFDGLRVASDDRGEIIIVGLVADQAALHGARQGPRPGPGAAGGAPHRP